MPEKPVIDPKDDNLGAVLNCAVRYCIGRQSYMPALVINYITPLLPYLSGKTLWCFDRDIAEARYEGGYGDPDIDGPVWMAFHAKVREERSKRGEPIYRSRRDDHEEGRA